MPLDMGVGLSPGDFVLDGDPVSPPQKGGVDVDSRLPVSTPRLPVAGIGTI